MQERVQQTARLVAGSFLSMCGESGGISDGCACATRRKTPAVVGMQLTYVQVVC